MRKPERLYGFYSELQRIHIAYFSDLRFGQFCMSLFSWIQATKGIDPFFVEESKMLDFLHEYANEV